ncbi:hypothetical protein CTAYLR_006893 [Chrysophaeum taylorii]|uniref:DNA-directed RNA polymerase III subunit RPC4 n=1 Tax=Chrysophaeum taylorii TaxID=2483200 RepID=A0AAD7XMV3_9STRA|nr:hypothetical protein CTAYLR_006893 [Chrysophaeum taylorii]
MAPPKAVKSDGGAKQPRKFAPRAPKRRPTQPVAPKLEPTEAPPPTGNEAGGRLRRGGDRNRSTPQGVAFFEAAPAARAQSKSGGGSTTKKEELEDVRIDDRDRTKDVLEGDDEPDDDPLAPIMLTATKTEEVPPQTEDQAEDQSEARRAATNSLFSSDDDLFVFQLPTRLPASLKRRDDEATDEGLFEPLTKLEPGPIGKLQILKSGRARLLFGDDILDVHPGLECSMLQQVVAVDDDHFTILGNVAKKVLVTLRCEEEADADIDDDMDIR